MEGSLLLGRLGIQESFGLEGLVEVNSGLLEAKNLGSRFRIVAWEKGLCGVRRSMILPLCLSDRTWGGFGLLG